MWADRIRLTLAAAAGAAAFAAPVPICAQDETSFVPPPVAISGTAVYGVGEQRDPFVPLFVELEPSADGPRFDTLRLTGVFLGSPGHSLVVLEDPARRGHFVRVGERIGAAVLIEIRPRSAVFEIREYGAVRRQVLELERSEESP